MLTEILYADRLVQLNIILIVIILVLIALFIICVQRNKKKLLQKLIELNNLSETLKQKDSVIQAVKDSSKKSEKYISIISREIKKPFNSFASISDVLMDEFDFLSNEEKISYIKQLNEGINTSINKFQNIFHWINYKSGNYRFNPETILLNECISENIKDISTYAHRKKIEFQTDVEPELKTTADRQMLDTILRNLLYNAMEASPINSKIIIQAFNTAGTIKLSVQDFGSGVSEQIKNQVFMSGTNRFSREIENDYSSGVGLLLVKEFVSRNGGELWLDSELNEGSKFTFTLPLSNSKTTN